MKEKTIKDKAVAKLKDAGFTVWCPIRNRWTKVDIFNAFDCVAIRKNEVIFVQWTSAANVSARVRKVKDFLITSGALFTNNLRAEVWGLKPSGEWRVVVLTV